MVKTAQAQKAKKEEKKKKKKNTTPQKNQDAVALVLKNKNVFNTAPNAALKKAAAPNTLKATEACVLLPFRF